MAFCYTKITQLEVKNAAFCSHFNAPLCKKCFSISILLRKLVDMFIESNSIKLKLILLYIFGDMPPYLIRLGWPGFLKIPLQRHRNND